MSDNPVEEIILELNKVHLKNPEVKECLNYQNIIEKICCNQRKRVECDAHFLTPHLMNAIYDSLKNSNDERVANTASFIALLGKYDNCRDYVSDSTLVRLLIQHLSSSSLNILTQCCRALANICYEKVQTQTLIIKEGGLAPVLELLANASRPNRMENDPKFKEVIIGLLLNLVADNEAIHKQIVDSNALQYFIDLIKADLKNAQASLTSQNVFIIMVALTETISVDLIFTEEVCSLAVEMFEKSYSSEFCVTGLEFLEDAELPDPVKYNLAKAGIFQLFVGILEKKPKIMSEEEANKYDLTGRVLANILTGDEAMEYLYELNDSEIMNHLTRWLSSDDKELLHTAVLCIGNIARTDRHSSNIVEKEIHKSLLNILSDTSNDIKIQYAVISTIRNLSIPRMNKVQLVKDGLIEILLPLMDLDVKTSSPVVFKLVGTLRQVIDGQESLAIELGCNQKIVHRLVTWSLSTIHPWVSSECSRFLCWLIKISKDRKVILNVLRNGGYTQIMKMLGALHGLMQSESVSALTVTSAIVLLELENGSELEDRLDNTKNESDHDNVNESDEKNLGIKLLDFESILVDGDVGEKLKHLILQHGVKMDDHILENIFTFLEIVTKFDKVRDHFSERGLKPVFHTTMQSRDDYNRFRYRIEEIEKSF